MVRVLFGVVCLKAVLAVSATPVPSDELRPGLRLGAPLTYRQLTVLPVLADGQAPPMADYLTLAAGLERKEVVVKEAGEGGQVNQVTVANRSARALLLLGGEVILGGQQDRIIGKDTIVSPRTTVAVQVFCVEHGRWSGGAQFNSVGGMAEGKIRVRAKYRSDQGEVWDEVAKKNASLGAQSQSGTYRLIASGDAGRKAAAPYRESILSGLKAMPGAERVVGVVAALNGRIVSADIFDSPGLFQAYRDRLLDSLFITAADEPVRADGAPLPAAADVKAFMAKADAVPATTVSEDKQGRTQERRGKEVVNSTVASPAAAGAFAKPVYQSYQRAE